MTQLSNHPTESLMLDYVTETISDGGRLRVDEHLAVCEACAGDMRALITLRENFGAIWDEWSAEQHYTLVLQMSIARATQVAEQSKDPRVIAWIKSLERGTRIGVKLLIDRGKQIAGIAAQSMPGAYEYEHRPRISGVGAPGIEAKLDERTTMAAQYLMHERIELAKQELIEASLIDSYATQSVNSVIYRMGKKYAEIVADGKRGSLTVKHWPVESGANAEYVLLLPKDEHHTPRLATLKFVQGEEYAVAVFDDVGDGASDVIIGPDA